MEQTTEPAALFPTTPAGEELALVCAAQADPEAFGLIYQRYVDRVFAYTRSHLANNDDAADVTQQVFIRAFQALPRYRATEAPFAAWLFRIAANAITDEFRRNRRPTVALQFLPESLSPPTEPPSAADETDRIELLRERIGRLSERERQLLAFRFAAGLTAREIAVVVGRSEAAVQKQLSRTLNTLKEHYRAQHLLP